AEPWFDFVPNRGRKAKVGVSMSNNFAFGGLNSSLVLARAGHGRARSCERTDVVVSGLGLSSLGEGPAPWMQTLPKRFHPPAGERSRRSQPLAPANVWRRMDGYTRMCLRAAMAAVEDARLDMGSGDDVAV